MITILEVKQASEIPVLPEGLSRFPVPYLRYWAKETLDIGGEVRVSKNETGEISGLFVFDDYESDGTVFTTSREVFDYFAKEKPESSLWSELQMDRSTHSFDILAMTNLDSVALEHKFRHGVVIETNIAQIERFMNASHYALNPKWVRVALANGDRCFAAKIDSEIVGIAWLSLVDGIGRVPDLYVAPRFRRSGVARDLFYARLVYLQSRHAESYFAEIAHDNEPALKHALKVGMKVSGQIFEYLSNERN